jgi:hypothetical protein
LLSADFEGHYDFALSFAGDDREIAKAISEKLAEHEIEVFYDENEQHRILAENVEEYLSPIYRSGAIFIVVLYGKEYPNRIWTNFESKQFKQRFGEKRVIPIWFNDGVAGTFDVTNGIGGLMFDRSKEFDQQIERIVSILIDKITEYRLRVEEEIAASVPN